MKHSILIIALIFALVLTGFTFAQDVPDNDENKTDEPATDENEPAKPPVPFKYLEDEPEEDAEPETVELTKPLIQFIFDSELKEKVEQLTNFMKNVANTYGDKLALRSTDVNKDEKAMQDWTNLLKEKNIEKTDVIVLIVNPTTKKIKFIIGLQNIMNTLAGHINFALEPDKYTDPFKRPSTTTMKSENFATIPRLNNQTPVTPDTSDNSSTIIVKNDDYKDKFEILIVVFIAFAALVVGFFVAWLLMRKNKTATTETTEN